MVRNFVACGTETTDAGKLKCEAKRQIDTLTGTKYVKVIMPSVWKKTAPLIVCAMVKSDGGIGLLPLPNGGWITSSTQMSIEQDATPLPTGTTVADALPAQLAVHPGPAVSTCSPARWGMGNNTLLKASRA